MLKSSSWQHVAWHYASFASFEISCPQTRSDSCWLLRMTTWSTVSDEIQPSIRTASSGWFPADIRPLHRPGARRAGRVHAPPQGACGPVRSVAHASVLMRGASQISPAKHLFDRAPTSCTCMNAVKALVASACRLWAEISIMMKLKTK